MPRYDEMVKSVVSELVNSGKSGDRDVANATKVPRALVEHVFDMLEAKGLLQVSKATGPNSHVFNVSPQLRRWLESS
jgi:hypothetical protein